MERTHVSQTQLVNQILKIGHGDLSVFADVGLAATAHEPELLAHLIAWNQKHGQVRDSKVALPVIALRGKSDSVLFANAGAHLCLLDPRDLVRATRFHRQLPKPTGGGHWLKWSIELYLKKREANIRWWDRTAVNNRSSMKTLYAMNHIKPSERANRILFKGEYPRGSVFEKIKQLKNMDSAEAAGTILNYRIPFLVAIGKLGGIKDKKDLILALVEQMTPAQLINNTAMLERWGVMADSVLNEAYRQGLQKKKKTKVSALKAEQAAKAVKTKKASKQLKATQEKILDDTKGIEGDWLVLGDRSGSMRAALDLSRQLAAFLSRKVKGNVHLVFFNTMPTYFNATDKDLETINAETRRFNATGGTSIGCGLDLLREKGIVVNGIAICSDGGDNTQPSFSQAYQRYAREMGCEPTTYLWHVPGESNKLIPMCDRAGIAVTTFEMGVNVDYYSIPQLAVTMRSGRYSLVEEIMNTKLLTYHDVFKNRQKGGIQ